MYLASSAICSSDSFPDQAGILPPFPLRIVSAICWSLKPLWTERLVKSGVPSRRVPFPSVPWHPAQLAAKIPAAAEGVDDGGEETSAPDAPASRMLRLATSTTYCLPSISSSKV